MVGFVGQSNAFIISLKHSMNSIDKDTLLFMPSEVKNPLFLQENGDGIPKIFKTHLKENIKNAARERHFSPSDFESSR